MDNLKNIHQAVENSLPQNEFSLYIEEILGKRIHKGGGTCSGGSAHCGNHATG